MNSKNNLIVITGIDSGIGKCLVQQLLKTKFTIVASYVDHNPFESNPRVQAIKMDLRHPDEVSDFCRQAKEACADRKLLALVVNSGVALGGPIENLPMQIYRDSFEINFFGAVQTIQALIPELIADKGRIIVNGSMAGKVAMPFLSPYASSKFALEGFCDSLRREMNPFGVKAILLEPGAIATPIWDKALEQDTSFIDGKYLDSMQAFSENFIEGGRKGMAPDLAAARIISILRLKHPKSRYIIASNVPVSKLTVLMPSRIIDRLVVKLFRMYYS